MGTVSTAENWTKLPKKELMKRCRQYAQEATRSGQPGIAKKWRDLANDIAALDKSPRQGGTANASSAPGISSERSQHSRCDDLQERLPWRLVRRSELAL